MRKYIDAEKLLAKIARRIQQQDITLRERNILLDLVTYIESLQQEQPGVDLVFQTFTQEMGFVFSLPKDITENTVENPLNWEYAIARHFYELGRKSKEESK